MIIRPFKIVDGVKVFDPGISEKNHDYNAQGLDNLFEFEGKHFWFIARKEYIFSRWKKFINKEDSILEVGAGTGNIARYLIHHGYSHISVGEMHLKGLKYAQTYGIKQPFQFDLLKPTFQDEFDAISMFDVLEHIDQDVAALGSAHDALKRGGRLILTVPAHMWLWNRRDAVASHKVRYSKRLLRKRLESAGFEILELRYFFMFLIPLLFVRTLLYKDDRSSVKEKERGNKHLKINKLTNGFLLTVCKLNNRLNAFLPNIGGGSILAVAIKK